MQHWELINEEMQDGFTIRFSVTHEDTSPHDLFMPEDVEEVIQKINDGIWQWFIAKVTAYRNGIELASDYLGGCCYSHCKEFLDDPYYDDMKQRVIEDSKQMIQSLTEA